MFTLEKYIDTYKNLYNDVENPLEKKNIVDRLMQIYADNPENFSEGLEYSNALDKEMHEHDLEETRLLETENFTDWKKGLTEIANNSEDDNLRYLVSLIQDYNPETRREFADLINEHDYSLRETYKKYDYRRFDFNTGWTIKDSTLINLDKSNNQEEMHRLFINCDSRVCEYLARRFINECDRRRVGYSFKYDNSGERANNFVIYSDTKHLATYLNMLREIKEELINEGLFTEDSFHEPSLLTGTIDGWIGYGTDPSDWMKSISGKKSYEDERAFLVEQGINKAYGKWLKENKDRKIVYEGNEMSFDEFYSLLFSLVLVDRLREDYSIENNMDTEEYIKNEIKDNYDVITNYFTETKNELAKTSINIPLKAKSINKSLKSMVDVMKEVARILSENIPEFNDEILEMVKTISKKYEVVDNFAFDNHALKSIEEIVKKGEECLKANNQKIEKQEENKVKVKQKTYVYKPMTNAEIEEARRKLGI